MVLMSDQIGELAQALSKAQGAFEGAKKDVHNTFLKSKYADLSSCWDAIRKPLADNGLSVVQSPMPTTDGNTVHLMTTILHASGQWISSDLTMPVDSVKGISDAQAYGVILTYARRYGLAAMVGITQEDDDGNTSKTIPKGEITAPSLRATPAPAAARPDPVAWLESQAVKAGYTDLKNFCEWNGFEYDAVCNTKDLQKAANEALKVIIAEKAGA